MNASRNAPPGAGHHRLIVLALALTFGFSVIVGQLFRWQVKAHALLKEKSDRQVLRLKAVPARRGYIADSHGRILAMDMVEWDISASPPLIAPDNREALARQLSPLLDMPAEELVTLFESGAPWVRLRQGVQQETGEAILDLRAAGIQCEPRSKRVYPEGELTAHVVGFVNVTGEGYYGVEGYYNQVLRPVEGVQEVRQDSAGDEVPATQIEQNPARPGTSLVLTLDLNIQYIAMEELRQALQEFGAISGTILVMEPASGAILASVSLPSYDPNHFGETDPSTHWDPAVSGMWEPGSAFKIVTWGAGLDAGTITPLTVMNDKGYIEVGGRLIRNWDGKAYGMVTATEALARSLNVEAAYISTSLGKDRFYTYLRRFGFGYLTDVDLASEGPGIVRQPGDSNWFPSDLGTNSFGQGLAVTPMQLIAAAAAIANGGVLMKPHIVDEMIIPGPEGQSARKVKVRSMSRWQVISTLAAEELTEMMVTAVETVAKKAQVPGYRVAGKSATAQIPTPYGYHPTDTVASFVGFAPADDPRFVVLVKLDRPRTSEWGTQTAAPTFAAVVQQLLLYLNIPPDDVRLGQGSQ